MEDLIKCLKIILIRRKIRELAMRQIMGGNSVLISPDDGTPAYLLETPRLSNEELIKCLKQ